MDQPTIDLIYSISTDAIKILGPAIIASYATYRVIVSQNKYKIKELDKNQEFGAREKIYNYYKERSVYVEKCFNELNDVFAETISKMAEKYTSENEFDKSTFLAHVDMYKTHIRFLPNEIEKILAELEKQKLQETSEYKNLQKSKNKTLKKDIDTFEEFKKGIYDLIEIYYFLKESNQLLLEREMKKSFGKYLKE